MAPPLNRIFSLRGGHGPIGPPLATPLLTVIYSNRQCHVNESFTHCKCAVVYSELRNLDVLLLGY